MGGFFIFILQRIVRMVVFVAVDATLGTERQPEIKQHYLQQFVAYENQDMNSTQ